MKIIIKFCEGKCTSCLQFILISLKINIRKFCQSKTLLITEASKPSFTSIRPVFYKRSQHIQCNQSSQAHKAEEGGSEKMAFPTA